MTAQLSMWSAVVPTLQIAWDPSCLNLLQLCPRRYKFEIIDGWRPRTKSVDLTFGGLYQRGIETYHKARLAGRSCEDATLDALALVLAESEGWGGDYVNVWRCTGLDADGRKVPFKNEKGNAAKCPFSHKDAWFPEPAPHTCRCGARTETCVQYMPGHPQKNRKTLLRAVAWACDDLSHPGALRAIALPSGTPAVELTLVVPSGLKAYTGEPYMIVGKLDEVCELGEGGPRYVVDNKTTTRDLGRVYMSQFAPSTQVDTYDFAAYVGFPFETSGVVIRACQTLKDGTRFDVQEIPRTPAMRDEYLERFGYWMAEAEAYAGSGHWPARTASCPMCPFKGVCKHEQGYWQAHLEADFVIEHWDPLTER